MFLVWASSGLRMGTGFLCNLRSLFWKCSEHPPVWVREQAAHCLIYSTPPSMGMLRLRELRVADGMAVAGITHSSLTLSWPRFWKREKKEGVAGTHISKRKKHVSGTHSCHLCSVTGGTPSPGGPSSQRKGMLTLSTLIRLAWGRVRRHLPHLRGMRKSGGGGHLSQVQRANAHLFLWTGRPSRSPMTRP